MSFCLHCGYKLRDERAIFCPRCGKRIKDDSCKVLTLSPTLPSTSADKTGHMIGTEVRWRFIALFTMILLIGILLMIYDGLEWYLFGGMLVLIGFISLYYILPWPR
jgi:uncharacterized membrane protein YvbJ